MFYIKKSTINFILICGTLTYLFVGNMLAVFSTGFPFREYVRLGISAYGLFFLFRFVNVRRVPEKRILRSLQILTILIIPITMYFYTIQYSFLWAIVQIGDALVWIGVFSIAYHIGLHNANVFMKSITILASCSYLYAALFVQVKIFSAGRGIPLISTAYYSLFFLPFVLLCKRKLIRWSGVMVILYTILQSMKRTGFIAFFVGILAYIIVSYKNTKKSSIKRIKILFAALIAAILIVSFVIENTQGTYSVLDRLLLTGEIDELGREEVWSVTIDMIFQSNPIEWLIGHGFDTVIENSSLKLSAHNDFLETIYDYGILGLGMYLIFYVSLWKGFKKLRHMHSEIAAPMACSLAITLVVSTTSHLIIYPTYFLIFCLFWGLIMGGIEAKVTRYWYESRM